MPTATAAATTAAAAITTTNNNNNATECYYYNCYITSIISIIVSTIRDILGMR